jgi:hypothetical protein
MHKQTAVLLYNINDWESHKIISQQLSRQRYEKEKFNGLKILTNKQVNLVIKC